jgi:phosphoribosylformylglycinamidine synthase PurS subunit
VRFAAAVDVMPKSGISDPQGTTIERALPTIGFEGIEDVRVGKRIEFVIEAPDEQSAASLIRRACERFLSNPVIEDFNFTIRVLEPR